MLNPSIFCFLNSVDSDQLASEPADLDLHCFPLCLIMYNTITEILPDDWIEIERRSVISSMVYVYL